AVAFGGAVYGLPLAAFGVAALVPSAALLAVVASAYFAAMLGLGVLNPLWETTLQRRIQQDSLGRVGSFDALISFATRPLGMAAAAPVAAVTGTAAPLLVLAVLVAGANLAGLLLADVRDDRVDPLGGPRRDDPAGGGEDRAVDRLVRDAD
ncbi:MAG: hypothetical protein IRY90_12990, partial [Actinomadura rubrobrunea]|nr:hypothetical protein [Actinomadura rubrobrunea]